MAVLTRRRVAAKSATGRDDESGNGSTNGTPLSSSPASSVGDLKELNNSYVSGTAASENAPMRKRKSLEERKRVPLSIYITVTLAFLLQYTAGLANLSSLHRWIQCMKSASSKTGEFVANTLDLVQSAVKGEISEPVHLAKAAVAIALFLPLGYVFFWAPFRAGLWTGTKARRHKVHRYMGLLFMVQYFFAWVNFGSNYEGGADSSILPHSIAVNGLIQSISAFLSFTVLPDLEDAGYYSDKAVLSRSFVHENIFYSLMVTFGSVYYNQAARDSMRSHPLGIFLELLFVFVPYVVLRPLFPTTRFKNAGTSSHGRSATLESFYTVATNMIKIFYLWAKYFLGFYINFLVYLDLVTERNWKFLHGLYLLNEGTVSMAVFLHTLRFKKVLPPRLTMTIYLAQIYLTFSAIPLAYEMYSQHLPLGVVCLAGIACNMTRSRKMHALWCFTAMALLTNQKYQWVDLPINW